MGNGESRVLFPMGRAALDVYLGMIGSVVALDIARNEELYFSVTGGLYLLTGRNFHNQPEGNSFEVGEGRSPGFFVVVSGYEALCLIVCLVSRIYLHYLKAEKKKLADLLWVGEMALPSYSGVVTHGYLHHGRWGWRGSQSLNYHTSRIRSSYGQKDVVLFM